MGKHFFGEKYRKTFQGFFFLFLSLGLESVPGSPNIIYLDLQSSGLRPAASLKKDSDAGVLLWILQIFKNTFFLEPLPSPPGWFWNLLTKKLRICTKFMSWSFFLNGFDSLEKVWCIEWVSMLETYLGLCQISVMVLFAKVING